MRRVLIVAVLIVAAAMLGLWRSHGGVLNRVVGTSSEGAQGEVRDEIRKSFQLQPGARLEVQGIYGTVAIETFESDMDARNGAQDARAPGTKKAEVYVVRTAKSSEALSRREVIIEQTSDGLLVRGKQARHLGLWEHLFGSNPNEQVTIKAPRQIALSVRGVNGHVTTGDIDGSLEAKGINGRVELGQANEFAEIGGINGNITVGLRQLSERGARLSGINGNIELRLATGLNADLTARGMNGSVRSEIPDVAVDKDQYASRYSARIGSGGAPITISGINGNVRLTRGEGPIADSTSTDKNPMVGQKAEKSLSEPKTFKGEQ